MRIAIPMFQKRVSPVFDWATYLLVVEADKAQVVDREEQSLAGTTEETRADLLAQLEVDVLLCGGISGPMQSRVENFGIRVIPWVAGEVDEVLVAYLEDRIPGEEFTMPGCCGRQLGRKLKGHGCGGRRRIRGVGPDGSTK